MEGVSVVLGLFPGARQLGCPSSKLNIWDLVPIGNPTPGMTGDDVIHAPLGVAEIMYPSSSMASNWVVLPTERLITGSLHHFPGGFIIRLPGFIFA